MKTGILGGTFDPIHQGHTTAAERVREAFGLDLVLLLVSRLPPHKTKRPVTSPYHRFAMAALATQDHPFLVPCPWELSQPGPSYTIEILDRMKEEDPEAEICFIAGSDSLRDLKMWREYDRLLKEHCFVFVQRPGDPVDLNRLAIEAPLKKRILRPGLNNPPALQAGISYLVQLDLPDVRSTVLRRELAQGRVPDSSQLLPAVVRYAQKLRLYEGH